MIPKIIHYCWFGGNPLPELAQKCIASWKKYCPDYEIREWNETNFDLNYNDYVREAYEEKKWAFVSDVARLYALVNYGGIYMDTDVELLKPIDCFLEHEAVSGFESATQISTALMGCREHFPLFEEFLRDYDGKHFVLDDGILDTTTNVVRMTNLLLSHGLKLNNNLQTVCGFALYPTDYFCPKDWETKKIKITPNTVSIHHFDGSWGTEEGRYRYDLRARLCWIMPIRAAQHISRLITVIKFHGYRTAVSHTIAWLKMKRMKRRTNGGENTSKHNMQRL